MRTFAQKPTATQQTTSAKSTLPGRIPFGQSREVSSIFHLQRTIGNQAVQRLLEANTGEVEGDSTIGLAHFGHDFSRIPVHAARPLSTARGQSPSEPALPVPMRGASPSFAFDFSQIPLFLGSQSGAIASANRAPAKCRSKDAGVEDEDKDAGVEEPPSLASPAPAPGVFPPNPAVPLAPKPMTAKPVTAKHVTPTFILDKKEDPRSNTKPSTQSKSPPTFVGNVVGDGMVWHYELSSVESKGKIRIVYFTDDHYPAPTPTDDSGTLSNVTKTNWKTIVDDLEKNKEGIPDFWSAYRAEDVHETYHWAVEWQGEMRKELVKAEGDIAILSLGVDKAPTAADAEKVLAPQATTVFNGAMKRADNSYQALPDSPGAPAYKAQIPVVTALKKRVTDHAKAEKW